MPAIPNPIKFLADVGNLVYRCKHCKEVFTFIDVGEKHEKECATQRGKHKKESITREKK